MLYQYRRIIKLLIAISALMLVLGVAGLVALHWYVSTDSFKARLAGAVKGYTGYDLVMEGDMGVTLYPWVGFAAGPAALRKPGVDEPLILAQRVSAGVRLLPLLSGELDMDTIGLEDVVVNVVKLEDGATHWDDLVRVLTPHESAKEAGEGGGWGMTVRGVQIDNGSLVYRDETTGASWRADGINLRTGVLEQGKSMAVSLQTNVASPEHEVQGQASITGNLRVDFASGHLFLDQGRLDAELSYAPLKTDTPLRVTATVGVDTAAETLTLDNLYAQASGLDLSGRAEVDSLLTAPVATGHIETRAFSPRGVINSIEAGLIPDDDPGIFREGRLTTDFRFDGKTLDTLNMDARMDDSRVTGSLSIPVAEGGVQGFDLDLDHLDFDRYYRLWITPEDFYLLDFFPEFLRTWKAKGTLRAKETVLAGEDVTDMVARLDCGDGEFKALVDQATAMGGSLAGDFAIRTVRTDKGDYTLSITSKVDVTGARAESLPGGTDEDYVLTGRGDMHATWEVADKTMAPEQIIDDLIRDSKVRVEYSLVSGGVDMLDGEGVHDQALSWSQARINLSLTGDGKGGEHDDFRFQTGAAFKVIGPGGDWDVNGKLTGPLVLDFPLDNVALKGADLGLQYHGAPLPEADRLAVVSTRLGLDTRTDEVVLSDLRLEAAGLNLTGDLTGRKAMSRDYAYTGNLRLDSPDPRKAVALLRGKAKVEAADPEALRVLKGSSEVLIAGDKVDLSGLSLTLDQTTFTGRASLHELGSGRVVFHLRGDQFDMDRYRSPRPPEEPEAEVEHDKDCSAGPHPKPVPLPLDTLRVLNLEGDVALGSFKIYGFRFSNLNLGLEASDGLLAVSPASADFYGGKVNGSLGIFVASDDLEATLDLDAVDFKAEDFLGDQFERDYVRGLSELHFHFKTKGATDDDLFQNLGGSSGFVIRDGSYKFLGAPKAGQEAKPQAAPQDNALGSNNALATGASPQDSRTAFSLAKASFAVDHGNFNLKDFRVEALALSATGEGGFNINKNTIDLAINADFLAAPDVPIYITGCLSDPDVSVPGDEILQNAVEDLISIPLRPLQFLRDSLF